MGKKGAALKSSGFSPGRSRAGVLFSGLDDIPERRDYKPVGTNILLGGPGKELEMMVGLSRFYTLGGWTNLKKDIPSHE